FLAVNQRLSVTKRVLWVVAVVVGLALLTQTSIVRSRVADLFASPVQTLLTQDVFEGGARSSLHTRIWLWINAAGLIRDRPVLGWGIGTWYSQLATATLQGFSLHSDYVHAAVETGLVGLAAFLMLRVSLLRAALGGIGTGKDEDGNQLASAALGWLCVEDLSTCLDAATYLETTARLRAAGWRVLLVCAGEPGVRALRGVEVRCLSRSSTYVLGHMRWHVRALRSIARERPEIVLVH